MILRTAALVAVMQCGTTMPPSGTPDAPAPSPDAPAPSPDATPIPPTYATTQITTLTYPGYTGNLGSYACPQPSDPGYTPLPINLHLPTLPAGQRAPLLVFFPGTADDLELSQLTSDLPDAIVHRAAQRGFAAAAVAYRSLDFNLFFPDRMDAKERCAWSSAPTSVVSQLCSNPAVDCTKGIVAVGHSQGGIMALLAANYDARVVAAYTLGEGITYDASAACAANALCASVNALFPYLADPALVTTPGMMMMGSSTQRVLPSRAALATAGDVDPYFAPGYSTAPVTTADIAPRLAAVASTTFIVNGDQLAPCTPATACTTADHAGHCFMSTGNSVGCVNSDNLPEVWAPDPAYFASSAPWALDAALTFLASKLPAP